MTIRSVSYAFSAPVHLMCLVPSAHLLCLSVDYMIHMFNCLFLWITGVSDVYCLGYLCNNALHANIEQYFLAHVS